MFPTVTAIRHFRITESKINVHPTVGGTEKFILA